MSNTRDFESLGIWGKDAEIVIPITPITGVAYRDEAVTQSQNEAGEFFDTNLNSAEFNQKMFIITSIIDELDKKGILGWTNLIDYTVPAYVRGSDGELYRALQASGPSGVGFKDPVNEPTYWELLFGSSQFELDLSSQTEGSEGAGLVGSTYQPDIAVPVVGQTVQETLATLNRQSFILHDLSLGFSGRFDTDGLLISNGFNINNNLVEKVTSFGLNFYRLTPADNSSPFLYDVSVTAERSVSVSNPTNLLTANVFVVLGVWEGDGITIDNTDTIKIVFSDPYNINTTFYPAFSVTGELLRPN